MRSTLTGIALGAAVAVAVSCSITHRSPDFACTKTQDCTSGRVCDNGFCVVAGTVDAPQRGVDGQRIIDGDNCPAPCTSCDLNLQTCTIDCDITSCTGAITCPTGFQCDVKCDSANSCRNGVNCAGATDCTVECSGNQSCRGVTCGAGRCDVMCTGASSCRTISCGISCGCDVTCTGMQSCDGVICTSPACDDGLGCSSVDTACHSC